MQEHITGGCVKKSGQRVICVFTCTGYVDIDSKRRPSRIYAHAPPRMLLVGMLEPVRVRDQRNDAPTVLADDAWPTVALFACLVLFFLWVSALYFFPVTP